MLLVDLFARLERIGNRACEPGKKSGDVVTVLEWHSATVGRCSFYVEWKKLNLDIVN